MGQMKGSQSEIEVAGRSSRQSLLVVGIADGSYLAEVVDLGLVPLDVDSQPRFGEGGRDVVGVVRSRGRSSTLPTLK